MDLKISHLSSSHKPKIASPKNIARLLALVTRGRWAWKGKCSTSRPVIVAEQGLQHSWWNVFIQLALTLASVSNLITWTCDKCAPSYPADQGQHAVFKQRICRNVLLRPILDMPQWFRRSSNTTSAIVISCSCYSFASQIIRYWMYVIHAAMGDPTCCDWRVNNKAIATRFNRSGWHFKCWEWRCNCGGRKLG